MIRPGFSLTWRSAWQALLVLACLSGGQPAAAAAAVPAVPAGPGPLMWYVTPTVVSQYLFRGVRLSGPAFQPSVEAAYGATTIGFWGNQPLTDDGPAESDPELDLYLNYTRAIAGAWSVVPGVTWYTFPRAERERGDARSRLEPSLALQWDGPGFRLTPKLAYDLTREGWTAEIAGVYAYPLTRLGTEVNLMASAGTFLWRDALPTAAMRTKNWGDYWSASIALPFQVTSNGRVSLAYGFGQGSGNYLKTGALPRRRNPDAQGRGWVSLSYMLTY